MTQRKPPGMDFESWIFFRCPSSAAVLCANALLLCRSIRWKVYHRKSETTRVSSVWLVKKLVVSSA